MTQPEPSELPTDDPALPRPFGSYVLLALLGRGGMGDVFLAQRATVAGISRRCVIKTLRPAFAADREYVSRFLDEARLASNLHHRNICPVFDVGEVDGHIYLAMEYIDGRDLRTIGRRLHELDRPLPPGLALHIACEVLDALDHAHRLCDPTTGVPLHVVHRDVSPHNVMIGVDGDVRLIDFGLAASTLKTEQTAPDVVMGKVPYMSPEQLHAEPLDGRADQFALAIVAYELFVSDRFYEKRSSRQIYPLAAAGGFRPERFATLPPELAAILDRALQPVAQRRFPTCGAMRDAIEQFRFSAQLRGDPSMLRATMQLAFGEELAEHSARYGRLALQAGARSDLGADRASDSFARAVSTGGLRDVAREEGHGFEGLATEPASPALLASHVHAHELDATRSAPTAAVARADAPARRSRFGVIAIVVGACIAAAAIVATRPADVPHAPVVAAAAPPATAAVATTTAAITAATSPSPALPTTTATTAANSTTAPTMPTMPTMPAASSTPAPPTTTSTAAAGAAKPTTTPRSPATTSRPAIGRTDAPSDEAPLGERVRFVAESCAALPCAGPIAARRTSWAVLAPAALDAFKQDVKLCVARCRSR